MGIANPFVPLFNRTSYLNNFQETTPNRRIADSVLSFPMNDINNVQERQPIMTNNSQNRQSNMNVKDF